MMRAMMIAMTAAALLACVPAHADGLADLKAALARAGATSPLRAALETRTWRRLGEGREADEDSGRAGVLAEDGPKGLEIVHPRELTARIDAELRAKARDPNSKTPALGALEELRLRDVMVHASAAPVLQRMIERGHLKAERAVTHQGKPARLLTFDIPISTLSTRDRKYAKQFKSTLEVWISADGVPLASRLQQAIGGRAFVVVSFESSYQEECQYALAGDRLLVLRRETRSSAAGAGERDERKVVTTLQPQA